MDRSRSKFIIASFALVGAVVAWRGSLSAEEQSVLVQKPAEVQASGPELPPPQNPKQKPATTANTDDEVLPLPPQRFEPLQVPRGPRRGPFMRPAAPRNGALPTPPQASRPRTGVTNYAPTVEEELIPAPEGGAPSARTAQLDVRPTPPIEYDTDGDARDMYRENGSIDLVMVTKNPADGCLYEIPLCVPACCVDEPRVNAERGIFGRGIVEYCWRCGFKAEVKFRHILGDVKVEYEGD
jgi:hypothetical protein